MDRDESVEPPPPGVEQGPPPAAGSLPRPQWFHSSQQPGDGWQQPGQFPWQQPAPYQFYSGMQQPGFHQWQQPTLHMAQQTPRKPYIDLPNFWNKDPASWFRLAEGAFFREGVTDSKHRFDIILKFVNEDTVEQLRDVLRNSDNMQDPYTVLKNELVRLFSPNILEQLNSIIFAPELGGQTPTQLMNKMLSSLPAGEPAGLLFKQHFILRMPADIRDQVSKKLEKLNAKELAEYADSRWHVRNSKPPTTCTVAAVKQQNIEDLVDAVAALPTGGQKNNQRRRGGRGGRGGNNSSGGSGGERQQAKAYVCMKHCRFGKEAWSCDDTRNCSFQGNAAAGGQ